MEMDVSGLFPKNWIQKPTTKKSLKFKTIHIYSQVAESHINQAIHNLQCIQYVRFQTGRKSPLAVSDNSGHFVLHHSTIHIIQKPLASSFIFREPSQMQVQTQGTIVNTTKSVLISGSLGRAAVNLSWCSAPAGASTRNGADIQGAQAGCRRGHRGSGHWACAQLMLLDLWAEGGPRWCCSGWSRVVSALRVLTVLFFIL